MRLTYFKNIWSETKALIKCCAKEYTELHLSYAMINLKGRWHFSNGILIFFNHYKCVVLAPSLKC